jgi:beta-glucosidase
MVTEKGDPLVPEGEFKVSVGGGQPETGAPTVSGSFKVGTSLMLPE